MTRGRKGCGDGVRVRLVGVRWLRDLCNAIMLGYNGGKSMTACPVAKPGRYVVVAAIKVDIWDGWCWKVGNGTEGKSWES